MKENGFIPLILALGVLIAVGFLLGGYYLVTHSELNYSLLFPKKSNLVQQINSDLGLVKGDYKKRVFEPKNMIARDPSYYKVLYEIPNDQLVGMKCSRYYSENNESELSYYDEQADKLVQLTDQNMLRIYSSLEADNKRSISAIQLCQVENGIMFVEYEYWGGGGGGGNQSSFGILQPDWSVEKIAVVAAADYGWPYFGCRNPLQVTKNGQLYYGCSGGDGGGGGFGIILVDLKNKEYQPVLRCDYSTSEDGISNTECQLQNSGFDLTKEINNFPVYPNSTFFKKEKQPICTSHNYISGSCGTTLYVWQTDAGFQSLDKYFKEEQFPSGWKCSAGVMVTKSDHEGHGETICNKGDLEYGLDFNVSPERSRITLKIYYQK